VSVQEPLHDALTAGDHPAASDAAETLIAAGRTDAALDLTARFAARDNPLALELLLELLDRTRTVHRIAAGVLLDHAVVDDVAQEAFISIVASIGRYRGDGKFTTWVHPIVRRRVVDHLRRQKETAPLDEELLPSQRMSSLIATRASVRDALAQLPALYREPVTMRDIDSLPYAEIAERLGRPEGTVKAQVNRGRAMLGGMLEDLDPEQADTPPPSPDPR
jgi:RNA polymerase sigma-70 factor (ECF subfamily)